MLAAALDLWMRVQLGQLDRLSGWYGDAAALLTARVRHAAPGAWPGHPHASWSIHSPELDDSVRVAYDIWAQLTGSDTDRGTITGTVTVQVEPAAAPVS